MSDDINFPTGFTFDDIISWGSTGLVCLDSPTQTVVKSPHDDDNLPFINIEKSIYERVALHGGHEHLLRYDGPFESGIRLEYAPNMNLGAFLKKPEIDKCQRLRWALQVAEALAFVHRVGIIHGDLTSNNVFLDNDLSAKLADFAGSSLDGSPLLISVTVSHHTPGTALSVQGDLFAYGSLLYEILTGDLPYSDLNEEEIETRFASASFPEVPSLGNVGTIIEKCWQNKYNDLDSVADDLRNICSA